MCTLVLLRRPEHPWPLLLAANRDEMVDRPWAAPGRHWADRPEVVAGLDRTGGGSWLGVNDHGLAAAILNRRGSLGPAADKRSRGELVLEALDHADALAAAEALAELNPAAYRSFNMVVADNRDAYWIKNPGSEGGRGGGRDGGRDAGAHPVEVLPVPEGLSMITAYDLNDPASPRIARHAEDLRRAAAPEPDDGEWSAWQAILARSAGSDPGAPAEAAMTVSLGGFQTVSSSLIALAAAPPPGTPPARWLFAAGRPDRHPYAAVDLALPPALSAGKGPVFGGF